MVRHHSVGRSRLQNGFLLGLYRHRLSELGAWRGLPIVWRAGKLLTMGWVLGAKGLLFQVEIEVAKACFFVIWTQIFQAFFIIRIINLLICAVCLWIWGSLFIKVAWRLGFIFFVIFIDIAHLGHIAIVQFLLRRLIVTSSSRFLSVYSACYRVAHLILVNAWEAAVVMVFAGKRLLRLLMLVVTIFKAIEITDVGRPAIVWRVRYVCRKCPLMMIMLRSYLCCTPRLGHFRTCVNGLSMSCADQWRASLSVFIGFDIRSDKVLFFLELLGRILDCIPSPTQLLRGK